LPGAERSDQARKIALARPFSMSFANVGAGKNTKGKEVNGLKPLRRPLGIFPFQINPNYFFLRRE